MIRVSIGAAGEETLACVKREGTLLFPVELLFLALPGVVLQLLLPDSMHQTEPMKEISATSQLPPQFLLGMGVVILMPMLGALALYALALRPGISVAEAIQLAFRRWWPMPSRLRGRSEEHTYELQSLMRYSYDVFCLTQNTIELHINK